MSSWTVTRIKAKIRELTGRPSTSQISDADLLDKINDFYVEILPQEVSVHEFTAYFEFDTVDGTGTKALSAIDSSIINVVPPIYVDGDQVNFWIDDNVFFQQYPHSNTDEAEPSDILLFGNTLYLRPIPDAAYTVKVKTTVHKPTAFTADANTPEDNKWGPFIAYGTSIEILQAAGENQAADELKDLYSFHQHSITTKYIQQIPAGKRSTPGF